MSTYKNTKRLKDIDSAKGLAIFLVVVGHISLSSHPAGNDWYLFLRTLIYKFHMPFFMYLSGYIMFYSYPGIKSFAEYTSYIRKKALRLMPGFILFGIIIVIGKAVAINYITIDNPTSHIVGDLFKVVYAPTLSPARSLWYIYVLFGYYLIFPLLLIIFNGRILLIAALALVVYFVPLSDYFAINRMASYLVFFSLGCLASAHINYFRSLLDRYRIILLVIFIISLLSVYIPAPNGVHKLIIGLASIPALHALVRYQALENSIILHTLSKYVFIIYLMNTIVIGLFKGLILLYVPWDGSNFLFIAPVLLAAGITVPIILKKYVFPYIPLLDRITT